LALAQAFHNVLIEDTFTLLTQEFFSETMELDVDGLLNEE
jgi:hypothetical protein